MLFLKKAWRDTFRLLGGSGLFFAVFAIAPVGFALHTLVHGWQAMMPEMQVWLIYGAAATGVVFSALFIMNLLCAPYRLERDAHNEAKAKLRAYERQSKNPRPRRLNAERQGLITSFLTSCDVRPRRMNVIYYVSDEATDFATDIGDALSAAGIDCEVHDGGFFQKSPKDRGLKIYRSNDATVMGLADGLGAELRSFGFPCEIRETTGDGNIFLYVARQSES